MRLPSGFKRMVEQNPVALSTIGLRGNPHTIVVAFVKLRSGKLVATDNYMGSTAANIKKRPGVSLAVWDESGKGFGIDGKASYHSSGKWLDLVKGLKENEGEPCKGAVAVSITRVRRLA